MSRIVLSLKGACAAAVLALAAIGLAGPAGAQYGGNPMLRNPGASTPPGATFRGPTAPRSPQNPYWKPGQFRSTMPGGANPGVRGTNTGCPPSRPNCNPTTQQ
jgi:hypothetical protein